MATSLSSTRSIRDSSDRARPTPGRSSRHDLRANSVPVDPDGEERKNGYSERFSGAVARRITWRRPPRLRGKRASLYDVTEELSDCGAGTDASTPSRPHLVPLDPSRELHEEEEGQDAADCHDEAREPLQEVGVGEEHEVDDLAETGLDRREPHAHDQPQVADHEKHGYGRGDEE